MSHRGDQTSARVVVPLRPRRPSPSTPPAELLATVERELRAFSAYANLVQDRLEQARTTTARPQLGVLNSEALIRLLATIEACLNPADNVLGQIDPKLAHRARVIADTQRELTPPRPSR